MAQAYTPGLTVSGRGVWRRRRILPITGEVLVEAGASVAARDVVARTLMPGDATPVNLARRLGVSPGDLVRSLIKKEGDRVAAGETLARTKGFFGYFQAEIPSPVSGVIESISRVTGQVIFRGEPVSVQVLAFLTGKVVEIVPDEGVIVEAEAALVQGIFGVGGEAYGRLKLVVDSPNEDLTESHITGDLKDCIVVGGRRVTGAAVRKAIEAGASAVIAGGIDDQDLREILGYDLGVAVTGTEKLGTTIIVTEGFGDISMAMRTFQLLKSFQNHEASVNGTTQIRAGVMRPEIVIPLADHNSGSQSISAGTIDQSEAGQLKPGCPVRIIREPHFGTLGTVTGMPHEQRLLESESFARVIEVQLADGTPVIVPRANVELIEG